MLSTTTGARLAIGAGDHSIPGGSARRDAAPWQVERPDTPQGTPGLSVEEVNPRRRQALIGSSPREELAPMDNQARGGAGGFRHLTGAAPDLATA